MSVCVVEQGLPRQDQSRGRSRSELRRRRPPPQFLQNLRVSYASSQQVCYAGRPLCVRAFIPATELCNSMLLLLSAAHGFMVTAGPRSSASMSTRRSFVVAASDIDKCCAGPPCPPPGSAPTHFAHAPRLASAGLSRESTHTHLTRTTSSATSRRRACTAVHMQQRAMHTVVPRDASSPAPKMRSSACQATDR